MADLAHFFGEDLGVSATGDLAVVDAIDQTTQRIIRRLMTAVKGYIFHPDYGAGVPQQIGSVVDANRIRSIINSQIFKEASVSRSPLPVITVTPFLNGVSVNIAYTNAVTGNQDVLSFNVES